jgi:UDP-N-acetyl-D-glucosamine dehydrogenase
VRASVIGLGKIGLPLAVQIAGSGIDVVGADINEAVVDSVNAGRPPFPGEPHLEEQLGPLVRDGSLSAVISTAEAVDRSDVVVVVVPLVVDSTGLPLFSGIDSATEAIGASLQRDQLVIYETTLPIGTTRNRFGSILERASGMRAGTDFLLAFSPERVSSGTVFRDLRRYPKIVGGVNQPSTAQAVSFYEAILQFDDRPDLERPNGVWEVDSTEMAEFVKLAETTYRDVNIALANEFARHSEELGLDYASIAEAANSQPYSHLHKPGIAVGGHCIPVYPRFYLAGDGGAVLPAAAREVNVSQPERSVARLESAMGTLTGKTIAVLGAAYRGGVKETAFSGVFDVVEAISSRGGLPVVHDPMYSASELAARGFSPYELGQPADAVVVQADHTEYSALSPHDNPGCLAILDGRGIVGLAPWRSTDIIVLRVGNGTRHR